MRFTPEQLDEIKKTSMARILCDDVDMKQVRPNAFRLASKMVSCDSIAKVSLTPWKDISVDD